ncbi:thiolase family protein [Spongiibacter sp. UBA1325]|jgi:acetyl-CoA C-acetyltransferase|uniref:thiolase family protein n=1 Tax=Spongiibacter sp. UBA1325 TaxID=1947543 RepID=UPI002579D5A8|nr:thiolase family protein [Spongiibacter sp. UBA1325]|tara:strand:- start:11031 stop:12263 length:1233 start_codon:yes stop_codon:yes gene_type:complete
MATNYDDAWLYNGCRTGFGELNGTISTLSATDLGIAVLKALLTQGQVAAEDVDCLFAANLAPSDFDAGYLPRHIGLYAGLPKHAPALMLQRLCGSGFELIAHAADYRQLKKAEVMACVGSESMSRMPVCSFTSRNGFKLGQVDFRDYLMELLYDAAADIPMGCTAENLAKQYNLSREEVDEFAYLSFERALAAQKSGVLGDEIITLTNQTFECETLKTKRLKLPRGVESFNTDEHVRPTSRETLAKLRPSFQKDGVQTGGNSSGIVDGAAAAFVGSMAYAERRGIKPLAKIRSSAAAAVDPHVMGIGPVPAILDMLNSNGLSIADIGLFEINEAFSAQCLAVAKELDISLEKLNVNGGATAYGHPLAATGVRCTTTLAKEMKRRGIKYGIASACVGGGQGSALLLENPEV